ncbi:MAG: hypothetical protein VX602_02140, partial [SAR324 cluster bacterium]|nr:hypothetical protein [SAR324 cluster bacterium]
DNLGLIEACKKRKLDKFHPGFKFSLKKEVQTIFGNKFNSHRNMLPDCDSIFYTEILRYADQMKEYRKRYPFLYEDDIEMLKKLKIEI